MSSKVTGAVWDMPLSRDHKLVLLAYADHADHDGRSIYPAVITVAKKTGYSTRSIQAITRELEASGRLVADGVGPHGTRRWRIPLALAPADVAGAESAPLQDELEEGVQPTAPGGAETGLGGAAATAREPSFKPSLTERDERDSHDQTPWAQVLEILRRGMDRSEFDTWVEQTELLSLAGEMLTVGCSNGIGLLKLERMKPEVEAAAKVVLGREVRVRFVVASREAA